jgi:hypothetical protein
LIPQDPNTKVEMVILDVTDLYATFVLATGDSLGQNILFYEFKYYTFNNTLTITNNIQMLHN